MKSLFLVMTGGALGASARYILARLLLPVSGWPVATFTANIFGGFAMGLLVAWLFRVGNGGEGLRLVLGVGFLGGFTTFSSFSLELAQMAHDGAWTMATAYAFLSVILAFAATLGGLALGRMVFA